MDQIETMNNTPFPPLFEPSMYRTMNYSYLETDASTIFTVNDTNKESNNNNNRIDLNATIPDLNENDVVFTDGKVTAMTEGNQRFKKILFHLGDKYRIATSQFQRDHMLYSIVRSIRQSNPPGRFFIFEEDASTPTEGGGIWIDAGNKYAVVRTAEHLKAESVIWYGLRRPVRANSVPMRNSFASGA